MKLLKSLAIIVHTLIFVAIGAMFILLSLNLFAGDQVTSALNYINAQPDLKMGVGVIGVIFVLGGLLTAQINLSRLQTEKTIAFENPDGQVTVSLSAIEDFIKKSVRHLAEVKELRSSVTANKRGINISCRAIIFADSNIPEVTEHIQNIIKTRVKDMLGVEETINIKIDVTKISPKGGKGEPDFHSKEKEETSRRMPFGSTE